MAIKHTYRTKNGLETKSISLGKAIRLFCDECNGWQGYNYIESCETTECVLWPFRFGKDPGRQKILTDEEKKELSDRAKRNFAIYQG